MPDPSVSTPPHPLHSIGSGQRPNIMDLTSNVPRTPAQSRARWAQVPGKRGAVPVPSGHGAPSPYIDPESDYPVCGVCPSLRFAREDFLIYDRPTREAPFNPADGFRYTAEGTPVCVHPDKIGLTPDRIAPPPETTTPAPPEQPRRSRWRPSFLGR